MHRRLGRRIDLGIGEREFAPRQRTAPVAVIAHHREMHTIAFDQGYPRTANFGGAGDRRCENSRNENESKAHGHFVLYFESSRMKFGSTPAVCSSIRSSTESFPPSPILWRRVCCFSSSTSPSIASVEAMTTERTIGAMAMRGIAMGATLTRGTTTRTASSELSELSL